MLTSFSCLVIAHLKKFSMCGDRRLTLAAIVRPVFSEILHNVMLPSVPLVHLWLRYIVNLMISKHSLACDSLLSLSVSVSRVVQFVTEVFTGRSLKTVLISELRNWRFFPLTPRVGPLSFLKVRSYIHGVSYLELVGSHCFQSSCYHSIDSCCIRSPASCWHLLVPAGAVAALLYLHQDLRKWEKIQNRIVFCCCFDVCLFLQ